MQRVVITDGIRNVNDHRRGECNLRGETFSRVGSHTSTSIAVIESVGSRLPCLKGLGEE